MEIHESDLSTLYMSVIKSGSLLILEEIAPNVSKLKQMCTLKDTGRVSGWGCVHFAECARLLVNLYV